MRTKQTVCSIRLKDLHYGSGQLPPLSLTSIDLGGAMPAQKFAVLLLLALVSYVLFDAQQYLSVDFFQGLYQQQPQLTALTFFVLYILVAGLSLPGAALLTVIGGIILDFWIALLLVSFASAIGATIAFLLSRYLFRDWVQTKFSRYLKTINQGVAEDGSFYLFSLRLIPLFPFW
ncbi:MAG: TVP38/TMEM64 family protein, partial [Porticoccaceae bacterium]